MYMTFDASSTIKALPWQRKKTDGQCTELKQPSAHTRIKFGMLNGHQQRLERLVGPPPLAVVPAPSWLLSCTLAQFSSCVRDPMALKPDKLHSGPLQKKFANP
mgnify:CR=1 FL=1